MSSPRAESARAFTGRRNSHSGRGEDFLSRQPNFAQNIGNFGPFGPMPNQKTMQTRYLGWFSVMWVTKRLISPVKIRVFCPKTTKLGLKLAFLFILGQALPAHLVPCWWVGWWWWRAGCISQDTYLLYLGIIPKKNSFFYCFLNCVFIHLFMFWIAEAFPRN